MDRKGYISDNLVNIRDRLKQQSAVPPENPVAAAPPEVVPGPGNSPVPLAGRAAERRMAAGDDARRDLGCRIARDLSRFGVEERRCRERAADLAQLQELLGALQDKVNAATPETHGALYARELDLLRIEYFRLLGRCENGPGGSAAAASSEEGRDWRRELRFAGLAIAGAVLLGAAVVAAAVVLVFR